MHQIAPTQHYSYDIMGVIYTFKMHIAIIVVGYAKALIISVHIVQMYYVYILKYFQHKMFNLHFYRDIVKNQLILRGGLIFLWLGRTHDFFFLR